AVPEAGERFPGKGGFPVSRRRRKDGRYDIYIEDDAYNFLIYGMTRSGKGETAIFPSIDLYSRAEKQSSMVLHDPKGELYTASRATLEERGYRVLALNLADPTNSMPYNPLGAVIRAYRQGLAEAKATGGRPNLDRAVAYAETVVVSFFYDPKDPENFWIKSARALANALILAVCEEAAQVEQQLRRLVPGRDEAYYDRHSWDRVTIYQVAKMLEEYRPIQDPETGQEFFPLDAYYGQMESTHPAKTAYGAFSFAEKKARSGICLSLLEKFQAFTSDQIAKMMSLDTVDLSAIGFDEERPTAIFLIVPDYDRKYHVIASLFINQLYFLLVEEASRRRGQRCTREVVFILDEAGNMPPIEGLESIVTVCLSRNIRFHLYLQAYGQLVAQYNEHIAKTVAGNCGYQVFIHSADYETCKMFSNLLGNRTETTVSRQGGLLTLDKSFNESSHERELMTPNELMHLQEREWILFRPLKRKRLDGSPMFSYPIFNKGESRMRYRYEYLSEWFDPSRSVGEVGSRAAHADRSIDELMYVQADVYVARLLEDGENVRMDQGGMQASLTQAVDMLSSTAVSHEPEPSTPAPVAVPVETKVGRGYTPAPESPVDEDWMTQEQKDLLFKEYMDQVIAWRERRVYDGPITRFTPPEGAPAPEDTVDASTGQKEGSGPSESSTVKPESSSTPLPTHGTDVPAKSESETETPATPSGLDLLDDTFGMSPEPTQEEPVRPSPEPDEGEPHDSNDEEPNTDEKTRTLEEWIDLKKEQVPLSKRTMTILIDLEDVVDIFAPIDQETAEKLLRPYLLGEGEGDTEN
ncbi:VirD4-like conjugal transfer protein, CD1115 family, partial [Exiguobacterium sp. 8A]|uniref:VirD4-like conjugal transfer protein, CD1115 family n=2 Tax=unclassified Exiguobacterium TaxID=2644629 RepID=UPI00135AAC00